MGLIVCAQSEPHDVAVNCRSCGNVISFVRPHRLGAEIGLKCSMCGRRMIYTAADLLSFGDSKKLSLRRPARVCSPASSVKPPLLGRCVPGSSVRKCSDHSLEVGHPRVE
jgi:hypothetical protein